MRSVRTIQRRLVTVALTFLAVSLFMGAQPASAAPTINDVIAVDAPVREKGGIMSPYTDCANPNVVPRNKMVLKNLVNGNRGVFRWRDSLPGYWFPRLVVGEFKATTTVRCAGYTRVRTQRVEIEQKTHESTVSRAEWRRVRVGMSRERVARVVGTDGRDPFRYGGRSTRTYDNMPFWAWSNIAYRNGRVVEKYWQPGHD